MAPHRVGFIGCGGMARGCHVPGFAKCADTEITAITEPSEQMRELLTEKCKELDIEVPVLYDDYRDMLAKEDLTIVGIFTPHTQHFEQACAALEAGCHLLVEKPMVTSAKEAHELAARLKAVDRILSIAYPGAFSPHHRAVREYIASGKAGAIKTASLYVMQGGWKNGTAGQWRQDPALSGGGQFYDTGSHLLNSMIWILDDSIKDVQGFLCREGTDVDINGCMAFELSKGTMATAMIGGHAAAQCIEEMIFYGEKATVRTGIWGGRVTVLDPKGEELPIEIEEAESLQDTFIGVIENRCPNPAPIKYGIYLSEMMDKIYANLKEVG